MPSAGSLADVVASVDSVKVVERFEFALGSMEVAGVVVMVADGDSVVFREDDVALAAEAPVPDLVLVRLGAFFSRNPSMNSMPIHRKM
tara:strand:- start:11 stop:274 length:264 start_codon:yes stop_codon:yes gene_type:complete